MVGYMENNTKEYTIIPTCTYTHTQARMHTYTYKVKGIQVNKGRHMKQRETHPEIIRQFKRKRRTAPDGPLKAF